MTSEIDVALREYAARWNAQHAAPPPMAQPPIFVGISPSKRRTGQLRMIGAIAAGVIVTAGAIAIPYAFSHADNGTVRAATVPPVTIAALTRIAHDTAADAGDDDVTASAVMTTRLSAQQTFLDGDVDNQGDPNAPVWLVQILGHFVCSGCRLINNTTSPPTGTVITLILSADTLSSSDFMLGNAAHDLSKAGAVVPLIP